MLPAWSAAESGRPTKGEAKTREDALRGPCKRPQEKNIARPPTRGSAEGKTGNDIVGGKKGEDGRLKREVSFKGKS